MPSGHLEHFDRVLNVEIVDFLVASEDAVDSGGLVVPIFDDLVAFHHYIFDLLRM